MDLKILEFWGKSVNPDIRRLNDMKEVIYDSDWLKTANDRDLYYMYRDLAISNKDRSLMLEHGLRYDITVIPPSNLGMEFVKTAGHYHPFINGTKYTYPEIYEVLNGIAHYMLQKSENGDITDVVMIEAKEGDKVIVPPNYGHVTINPSNKELKMANWVSREFSSTYGPYQRCGGAAYFELTTGEIIQNNRYQDIPEIRYLKPSNTREIGLSKGKEMYGLIHDPEKLRYLNDPQDFDWIWNLMY